MVRPFKWSALEEKFESNLDLIPTQLFGLFNWTRLIHVLISKYGRNTSTVYCKQASKKINVIHARCHLKKKLKILCVNSIQYNYGISFLIIMYTYWMSYGLYLIQSESVGGLSHGILYDTYFETIMKKMYDEFPPPLWK